MIERRKRIVIATDNFLPRWDGIARFLTEIIPRLKRKYDITVIAPDYGNYEDNTIDVVKIPVSKWLRFGDFYVPKFRYFKIRKAIKRADIVFSQSIGPIGMRSISMGKKMKKPVVAFVHSIEWELVPNAVSGFWRKLAYPLTKRTARKYYKKCSLLIVPSKSVADAFFWQGINKKTEIVHLGTDTEKFVPAEDKALCKESLGIDELKKDDIVIGYHGRIGREKDLVTLLRAFIKVQQKYRNTKLLIVGEGVESIKNTLKSREGVILTGQKSNVVPYLNAMDIYVLPSLTETTCLSVLEAMSCGLPVIATQVGFVKDYIKDNVNGFFFQMQNPYHLAKEIEKLIADDALRKKIGENARKTVVSEFKWDDTAKKIENALESL